MRVCVLGHRGMLGHVLVRVLSESGYNVVWTDARFAPDRPMRFVTTVAALEPDWVINTIGVPPHALREGEAVETFEAMNAQLPQVLARSLPPRVRLLQASTDAVFQDGVPDRRVDESPDASDIYGISKLEGELHALARPHSIVIRCSIIGRELGSKRYLLEWILAQRGTVPGFANHLWNGITTLEWARRVGNLMRRESSGPSEIQQIGISPAITKADLLQLIAETWNHSVTIEVCNAPRPVNRSLVPTILAASIRTQLRELQDWHGHLGVASPAREAP